MKSRAVQRIKKICDLDATQSKRKKTTKRKKHAKTKKKENRAKKKKTNKSERKNIYYLKEATREKGRNLIKIHDPEKPKPTRMKRRLCNSDEVKMIPNKHHPKMLGVGRINIPEVNLWGGKTRNIKGTKETLEKARPDSKRKMEL